MKLTARLLKKIIRESVQKGVPGIGKFYADEEGKLDPESAHQAVDLSAMLGQDIEPEDLDETILIEIKEIMADFVAQYYQNFIQQANEAEGGDNYPDEFDPIPGVRQRIDAIIDKNYYTQPRVINTSLSGVATLTSFQAFIGGSKEEKKARRQKVKAFKAELKKLNRFFKSYEELLDALSPGSQEFLKSLNAKDDINRKLQKNAQIVKANQAIKMRPIPDYQNMIRLAKTRQEVASIFNVFKKDIHELKKFMSENLHSHFGYGSMIIPPMRFVIDPERVEKVHQEPDFSWTENAPRKTIEHLDQNQKLKSSAELINEIESYISGAISGEFVASHADPMVKQKFLPKKFPMTEAILKKVIFEELSSFLSEQEDEDFTKQFEVLFSSDADQIIQGLRIADSIGLTPEQLPFDKLDLSKQNIPEPGDLLRVAETVLDTYGDYIVSYLRRKLISAMEKGLRRRLEMGMTTGLNHSSDRIRKIIKNELTSHKRKINVIGSPKSK